MAKALNEMTQVETRVELDLLYNRLVDIATDRNPVLFAAALGRLMGETVEDTDTFMRTLLSNAVEFTVCECPDCTTRH